MINAEQIREIISQYEKHGWTPRRVLLSAKTSRTLGDSIVDIFGRAEIALGEIDAVWFTRQAKNDRESWELRHLSEMPFALFESFGEDDDDDFREETRKELETLLKTKTSKTDS